MKYLLVVLFLISLRTQAQPYNPRFSTIYNDRAALSPHVELGFSGGFAIPFNISTMPAADKPNPHSAIMLVFDSYHDRHSSPFCFAFGARIGAGTGYGFALALGTKYEKKINNGNKLRVGLMVSPWVEYASGPYFGLQGNIISELTLGTLLWDRLYIGLKHFQPYLKYEAYHETRPRGGNFYPYLQTAMLADIKFHFGKRE